VRGREPQPKRRATYTRPHGVRNLMAPYDPAEDKMYDHVKKTKTRTKFLEFCRYLRTLYPADVRIAIVCDNFSPHLTTKRCRRVADWAEASNVEIAYTPDQQFLAEQDRGPVHEMGWDGHISPSGYALGPNGKIVPRIITQKFSYPMCG
jgi:hypothetical protein